MSPAGHFSTMPIYGSEWRSTKRSIPRIPSHRIILRQRAKSVKGCAVYSYRGFKIVVAAAGDGWQAKIIPPSNGGRAYELIHTTQPGEPGEKFILFMAKQMIDEALKSI